MPPPPICHRLIKSLMLKLANLGGGRVLDPKASEVTSAPHSQGLGEILPADAQEKLELFKIKLTELHEANKIYARFVVTLNEFFNSLVSAILPMKEEGYQTGQPRPAAFLQVSA